MAGPHRRPAVLPQLRAELAHEVPRAGAPPADRDRRPRAGRVPRRHRAQPRRLVRRVRRRSPGRRSTSRRGPRPRLVTGDAAPGDEGGTSATKHARGRAKKKSRHVAWSRPRGNGRRLRLAGFVSDPVFVTDRHNRVVLWNQDAERLLGFSAGEDVGKPCAGVSRAATCSGTATARSPARSPRRRPGRSVTTSVSGWRGRDGHWSPSTSRS